LKVGRTNRSFRPRDGSKFKPEGGVSRALEGLPGDGRR
jgi:hypothetical protein